MVKQQQGAGQVSRWELAVAVLGAALVSATFVHLGHEALRAERSPPELRLEVREVRPSGEGFLVRFSAHNEGGSSAAELRVRGELAANAPGQAAEVSEAVLDYVPAHSERGGGLFFRADPRARPLTLRALGYREP